MKPNEIKLIRIKKGMTQTDFAKFMHTTSTTVSRWETGTSKPRPIYEYKLEQIRKELE